MDERFKPWVPASCELVQIRFTRLTWPFSKETTATNRWNYHRRSKSQQSTQVWGDISALQFWVLAHWIAQVQRIILHLLHLWVPPTIKTESFEDSFSWRALRLASLPSASRHPVAGKYFNSECQQLPRLYRLRVARDSFFGQLLGTLRPERIETWIDSTNWSPKDWSAYIQKVISVSLILYVWNHCVNYLMYL